MRMRLMWLGSTGGIPEPLLFLSNINDSREKVECSISVSVRGNIHFVFVFEYFGGRGTKKIYVFVILSQNVIIYALKMLSDWMVAWRFRKSSPKHQIWSGRT